MEFKTIHGGVKRIKNAKKRIIDWNAPSKSKRQREVKKFLKKYWKSHVVFEEFPVVGSRLTLDFYNATKDIAIEVQGKQHTKYNKFFHKDNKINYLNQLKRDDEKLSFCELNNIQLLEVHEDNVDFDELYKSIC